MYSKDTGIILIVVGIFYILLGIVTMPIAHIIYIPAGIGTIIWGTRELIKYAEENDEEED